MAFGDDGLTLVTEEFERQMSNLAAITSRSVEEEFTIRARAVVLTAIKITPPFGPSIRSPRDAKEAGQNAINRDLRGGRTGYHRGARRQGVFTVLDDGLIDYAVANDPPGDEVVRLWVRKDGTVYGTEKSLFRPNPSMAEMRDHHKRYFKNGRMSRAGSYTRDIARWKWLDRMVVPESAYKRYLNSQYKKVGRYAAGLVPAARRLGAKPPAFVARHSSPGMIEFRITPDRMRIVFLNQVGYRKLDGVMQRRVEYAISVEAAKIARQIPHILKKAGRQSGLKYE